LARALFLTPSRTLSRKIKELLLSLQIERHYTKEEILERYLNKVYFGHGNYGVQVAARFYFGKDVEQISVEEAALLAGLIRAPSLYSPLLRKEACMRRTKKVLYAMVRCGFLDEEDAESAKERLAKLIQRIEGKERVHFNEAPYFTEHVRRYLEEKYGELLYKGGLHVYTTCDVKMQKMASKLLSEYLKQLNETIEKEETQRVEGALVAIQPSTGYVKVMVGGSGFSAQNQLNRVVQARRQPGSAFKPFLYLAAIEQGYTPSTILHDVPLIYPMEEENEYWIPQNYQDRFYGPVTLRRALELSLNAASIRLAHMVKPWVVADYAKRVGIEEPLSADLSIALGTSEVTPLSMCAAFSTLANGGVKTKPIFIRYIMDKRGQVIEEPKIVRERVISKQSAYMITYLLEGVIRRGTGWRARIGRVAAGKTGTSDNFCDAWFIGYVPQLCAAVWIGFDEGRVSLGEGNTGGRLAAPLWASFMKEALKKEKVQDFLPPEGIKFVSVDVHTGACATSACPKVFLEAFIEGREPQQVCKLHSEGEGKVFSFSLKRGLLRF
jgi:penicillin-binding protein 1A